MTKEEFLSGAAPWSNHRHFLWLALEATRGSHLPVLEMGAGEGSTPHLRRYCREEGIAFVSCDSNFDWALKCGSFWVPKWDEWSGWGDRRRVVLLDLAPGEYRRVALAKLQAEIVVVHDSEPAGWNSSDYRVRPLFENFKYVADDVPSVKGEPWTTALSNTIDVSGFRRDGRTP